MIELNDLGRQYQRIEREIAGAVRRVLARGQYVMGPEVGELEERLAGYAGVRHAVACSSGTDALTMTLMAWGIGPGDAVFTPAFTFVAAAEAARLLGATPMFVDVDGDSFLLNANQLEKVAASVAREGKLRPKAVIPADLFGAVPDYGAISEVAARFHMFVLEDAAQGFGARLFGNRAGSFGHAAATSFFPSKPLGCYGDGGAVLTDDGALADALRSIRSHGRGDDKYDNVRVGLNARLDTLQAAVVLVKLGIFDEELSLRQAAARRYTQALQGVVTPQRIPPGCEPSWSQYSVMAQGARERGLIRERLKSLGAQTAVYYPKPLHLQKAFTDLGGREGDLPRAEDVCKRIVSLPMHPYLTGEEIETVIRGVRG